MSRGESFFRRWSDKKQDAQRADDRPTETESVELVESDATGRTLPIDVEEGDTIDLPAIETSKSHNDVPVDTATAESGNDNAVGDQSTETEEQETLETLLSDEDMPEITTLSATSDLTGFFNRGVSAQLRRAALRHVFQLPSYNVRDGLNDYDDDFTYFEPLGDTVTSDMKCHTARKELERLERERLDEEARQAEEARLAETEPETEHDTAADESAADDGDTDETQESADTSDDGTDEQSADANEVTAEADATDFDTLESATSGEPDIDDTRTDGAASAHASQRSCRRPACDRKKRRITAFVNDK